MKISALYNELREEQEIVLVVEDGNGAPTYQRGASSRIHTASGDRR